MGQAQASPHALLLYTLCKMPGRRLLIFGTGVHLSHSEQGILHSLLADPPAARIGAALATADARNASRLNGGFKSQ